MKQETKTLLTAVAIPLAVGGVIRSAEYVLCEILFIPERN